jgi:putative ABC transport system permease protein
MPFLRTLKINFRQLRSQKLNTAVHIAGLSLGMTVCLLIGLFIRFELSFDKYHPNAERTYRINEAWKNNGEVNRNYSTPLPMLEALRKNVAGLEHVTIAFPAWNNVIDVAPGKRFDEPHVLITDTEFLKVFKVDAVKGDPAEILAKPYHALLTESIAKKYYGDEDPIGKVFRIRSQFDITVGGVIKDMPSNTHIPATMIISYIPDEKFLGPSPDHWMYTTGSQTYVTLPEGFDKSILLTQLQKLADDHINSDKYLPKFLRAGYDIVPLTEIHFDTAANGSFWVPAVSRTWIWFFGIVGMAVLLLACINFVNLSTAQALTRAKEVGIRKTVGAGRLNLVLQFLSEAWLLALVSGLIAIGSAQLLLPMMNTLLEKSIPFDITSSPDLIIALAFSILVIGLLAGLYPAWIITRFNPATSLRSNFTSQGEHGSSWLRRSLVVVQFCVSAGLLIALMIISSQVSYMHNKDLGFDKENIVMVNTGKQGVNPVFDHGLEKIPQVENWSFSTAAPTYNQHWGTVMSLTGNDDPSRQNVTLLLSDEKFCQLFGFKLLAGRYLMASDTNSISRSLPAAERRARCIVNEQALKILKVSKPEEAIGKKFWAAMGTQNYEVVGVVSDFNTTSLHSAIKPVIITPEPLRYGTVGIKITPGSDVKETMASIEAAWKVAYPDAVFTYKFLNEEIADYYKSESRIFSLFRIFSAVAMLISCLGLWGLITFTAQRRTKEIGIRKVLGATASSIMVLLSREFLFMVLISLALATPLVYYGINQWLDEFAFRVPVGWQSFAIAGSISIALALITVGIQSLRATFTNPASVLKSE